MSDPRKELNGVVMDCVSHPKGGWSATVHFDTQVSVGTYLTPVVQQARADLEAENKRLREALQNIKHMKTFAIETTSDWCPLATEMVEIARAALESKP